MQDFQTITYQVEAKRARITLNRPEKLNALSNELPRARVEGPELRDEDGRLI